MPKSAEQMNQERRLVKARQQANAKAKAVHKSDNAGFDAREAMKEQRRFQNRRRLAEANGKRLLEQVRRQGSMLLSADATSEEATRIWLRNCRDLIAAAKADPNIRYFWNKDWEEKGYLAIGVPKGQKRPAIAVA